MRIINELLKNSYNNVALTTNKTYTYKNLIHNINEYSKLLEEYQMAGIDRVAVIINKKINFDTLSLILALIESNIKPVIINERIDEQINTILKEEDIKITFYESILKPEYLRKTDIVISEDSKYFVTTNLNVNVKNKRKIKDLKWCLKLLKSKTQNINGICKLYDIVDDKIEEHIINENDITNYANVFSDLKHSDTSVTTSLPLYKKDGFLYLISALLNGIHSICLNQFNVDKNITKILNEKPSIITIDAFMLLYLIGRPTIEDIDFNSVDKVLIDSEIPESSAGLVFAILSKCGFKGSYIRTDDQVEKEKIIELNK